MNVAFARERRRGTPCLTDCSSAVSTPVSTAAVSALVFHLRNVALVLDPDARYRRLGKLAGERSKLLGEPHEGRQRGASSDEIDGMFKALVTPPLIR